VWDGGGWFDPIHLQQVFDKEPFVHVLEGSKVPETRYAGVFTHYYR